MERACSRPATSVLSPRPRPPSKRTRVSHHSDNGTHVLPMLGAQDGHVEDASEGLVSGMHTFAVTSPGSY